MIRSFLTIRADTRLATGVKPHGFLENGPC